MAAAGEVVGHRAPHQRAAMAVARGIQFGGRHPQRAFDAGVQRAGGVVAFGFGGERETQVMAAGVGLPLVGADEGGQAHVPAGLLARLAQGGVDQGFVGLEVAGRLVEDHRAIDPLLDAKQPPVADDDRRDGHVGLPEAAFAIAHAGTHPPGTGTHCPAAAASASMPAFV